MPDWSRSHRYVLRAVEQKVLWRQILQMCWRVNWSVSIRPKGVLWRSPFSWVGVGAGRMPTACRETIQITGKTAPNPNNFTAYRDAYEIYQALPATQGHIQATQLKEKRFIHDDNFEIS